MRRDVTAHTVITIIVRTVIITGTAIITGTVIGIIVTAGTAIVIVGMSGVMAIGFVSAAEDRFSI